MDPQRGTLAKENADFLVIWMGLCGLLKSPYLSHNGIDPTYMWCLGPPWRALPNKQMLGDSLTKGAVIKIDRFFQIFEAQRGEYIYIYVQYM